MKFRKFNFVSLQDLRFGEDYSEKSRLRPTPSSPSRLVSILKLQKFPLHRGGFHYQKKGQRFACGVRLVPLSSLSLEKWKSTGNRAGSQVVQRIEYLHDHKLSSFSLTLITSVDRSRMNVDSFVNLPTDVLQYSLTHELLLFLSLLHACMFHFYHEM